MGPGKRRVASENAGRNASANRDGEAAQGGGSRKRQTRGLMDGVTEIAPVTMCLTMQCDRRQLAGRQAVVNAKVVDAVRKVMLDFGTQNVEMAWSRVGEGEEIGASEDTVQRNLPALGVQGDAQCLCFQDPCACMRWREELQAKGFCITTLSRLSASPDTAPSPSSSKEQNEEHVGKKSGMQEAATENSEEVDAPPLPQLSSPQLSLKLPKPGAAALATGLTAGAGASCQLWDLAFHDGQPGERTEEGGGVGEGGGSRWRRARGAWRIRRSGARWLWGTRGGR